jgi:hypothetical protein
MVSFLERVVSQENLEWAWKRAKNCYRWGDVWYDELEVINFELKLSENLEVIGDGLKNLSYDMSPMNLVPQPKKLSSEVPYRQFFSVPIKDQVAWIAVVNILGPVLDSQMSRWSYGNRLYRSVWYEEDDRGKERLRIGSYRSYSGRLFATFHQSWPRHRRDIYFTYRNMIRSKSDLSKRDQQAFDHEKSLPKRHQLAYMWDNYFRRPRRGVFYAGLDFEKFYPSIKRDIIIGNIKKYFRHVGGPSSSAESEMIGRLVKKMLEFPVDYREWSSNPFFRLTDEEQLNLDVHLEDKIYSGGIPTGLFVAGFLANVALIDVDRKVDALLHYGQENYEHDVAHFRYVDDHIILATSFEKLLEWKEQYEMIVKKSGVGISFNPEKTEPEPLRKYFTNPPGQEEKDAIKACRLDKDFPAPFMTKTLTIISDIGDTHFELLDNKELEQLLSELEHLLVADFPDTELREDTRISFAAMKLSQLGSLLYSDATKEGEARKDAKRLLALLIKALEKNPEKLRIWKRTIEFCRLVGLDEIQKVVDLIHKVYATSNFRLCQYYLNAYLIQFLADQLLKCVWILASDDSLHSERQAATRFLRSVFRLRFRENQSEKWISYVKSSHDRLGVSRSAAAIILPNIISKMGRQIGSLMTLLSENAEGRPVNLKNRELRWYGQSGYEHGCWCVWVESRIGGLYSLEPSIFWETIVELADPKEAGAWFLWKSHPRKLPDQLVKNLLSNRDISWSSILGPNSNGFLLDLLFSRSFPKEALLADETVRKMIELAKSTLAENSEQTNLFSWCDWTRREFLGSLRSETVRFDPRLSEWTALEIVSSIARELQKIDNRAVARNLHPANIILPKTWMSEFKNEPRTWEEWRGIVQKRGVDFKRNDLVEDWRFSPESRFEYTQLSGRKAVRSLGLILLGLLLRSFEFPHSWNARGRHTLWVDMARKQLKEYPCSTWTMAIVDACLSIRQQERIFLKSAQTDYLSGLSSHKNIKIDDDAGEEGLIIERLDQLEAELSNAQKRLKKYQMTARNHEPKQLIPLTLRFLLHRDFEFLKGEQDGE